MENNKKWPIEKLHKELISTNFCESLKEEIYESMYWELINQNIEDITCFYIARGLVYGDEDALELWNTLLVGTWEQINHEPLYHILMEYIWSYLKIHDN